MDDYKMDGFSFFDPYALTFRLDLTSTREGHGYGWTFFQSLRT